MIRTLHEWKVYCKKLDSVAFYNEVVNGLVQNILDDWSESQVKLSDAIYDISDMVNKHLGGYKYEE